MDFMGNALLLLLNIIINIDVNINLMSYLRIQRELFGLLENKPNIILKVSLK